MASTTPSQEAAISARSSHSPIMEEQEVEAEEPRKKGARGGKRSVTHLSKAQLERKRANDREAQRNIRQRTKEHIEYLQGQVKELKEHSQSSSLEQALRRNKELENEVDQLRAQLREQISLAQTSRRASQEHISHAPADILIPQKTPLGWIPKQEQQPDSSWDHRSSNGSVSRIPRIPSNESQCSSYPVDNQVYPPETNSYDEVEDVQQVYPPASMPIWNDPMAFGANDQDFQKQNAIGWAPFQQALSQPSRFADLNPIGFSEVINTPTYTETTCWQQQPSLRAWEISTKLKAPVTLIDQLIFSIIGSQRHLHIASDAIGEKLIGPEFPSVNILFNQEEPTGKPPSTHAEVMARYAAVLSNRGFELIPEKLASFMCMYRFIQWQISPDPNTYKALHNWQAPCPSQLSVPHPAWMDLPPWPSFRDKVISDQAQYDNDEFQSDYASNLSVNFPHNPMEALVFEDGRIMVSRLMDRHLSNIKNMSMKLPFALKYPEFKDVCRFDAE
ncbi:hypothetical protein BJ878DRAFT_517102 [Calycina marina]|uniref:BZIP transcription factor n=1 Tax=Calycina marina TaxID=1763456 RepID=A0A9P7YYL1_9HELO|nr:hypothetical protein BJ878DRAFT_517102 [Calycina marina]